MTKSNFSKLAKPPAFARPPSAEESLKSKAGYGAVRARDGRTARRTGRTVQFATVVSQDFKDWMKGKAREKHKSMAALLDDMRAAYTQIFGE